MQRPIRRLRAPALVAGAAALLLSSAPAALAGPGKGGSAEVSVDHACDAISVSSSKDISNVVLQFLDGDRQRFEDLPGSGTGTFAGTGDNAGDLITTAWVKAGNNASGDGPGYGERFDFSTDGCQDTPDEDTPDDDTPDEDPDEDTPDPDPDEQRRERGPRTNPGGDARITVTADCDAISVSSSKDISNVVLQFLDGDRQRFEDLPGSGTGTFAGTGDNAGDLITTAWVKAGNNASGDGPGYGERFDFSTDGCQDTPDEDTPDEDPDDDAPVDDPDDDTEGDDPDDDTDDTPETQVLGDDVDDDQSPPAPDLEPRVLGVVVEADVAAAADDEVGAAGALPVSGATVLTALLVALAALGLGAGLVHRSRLRTT